MGIGAACVRVFRSHGWNVSVVALPDSHLSWLDPLGVLTTPGDITSAETRERTVELTMAAFGRIDVLINNAGVGLYALPVDVPPELFSRLLEVNVVAPLALAQLVTPVMVQQGSGSLVTLASPAARVALPWAAAYSASKAALHSLHDSLRRQLRGTPIHLLKVYPGIVDTNFRDNVLAGTAPTLVKGISYITSADALASAIFSAVERRKKNLYLPPIGALFCLAGELTPWLMDWYLARYMRDAGNFGQVEADSERENSKGSSAG